jgi:hypothetical protein
MSGLRESAKSPRAHPASIGLDPAGRRRHHGGVNAKPPPPTARERREAELAAALRANLRRRKVPSSPDATTETAPNKEAGDDEAPLPNTGAPG